MLTSRGGLLFFAIALWVNAEGDGTLAHIAEKSDDGEYGGGDHVALLRQQLAEFKSKTALKVASLERRIRKAVMIQVAQQKKDFINSEPSSGGRRLLGAEKKPLSFGCEGDIAGYITSFGMSTGHNGMGRAMEWGSKQESRLREGAMERSRENHLHRRLLGKGSIAKHEAIRTSHKARERGHKAKHKAFEASQKAKALGHNLNHRAAHCKGPGCHPCTPKMCSKRSCSSVCNRKPRYCIRGVGCVTAEYEMKNQIPVDSAKEVRQLGWPINASHGGVTRSLPLGNGNSGLFPMANRLIPSADGRCFAKLSFSRITNQVPSTLHKRFVGKAFGTMDVTAHILEASICNTRTKKCAFQKMLLACYKWQLGLGHHTCTKPERYAVMQ
jgi:hypothetical protein